ncbi:dihydrolipoyl dehydrogenase family protein [Natronoflexus pectinivorans]|uniref:Dihydrolipoamide dehydrogenase n=1 Tax=Natronoflexus pectinivorans TaxID=682526 RepID=A0A4V2RVN1_9BACT|nr:NAD(P)/FAD-dependent oxidoreductase [Natronoflexus pectinivorans]TCO04964.1 dihydrolipoamide dehydrogenase [Natronoflexus pectinivorans]
MKQYDLVIIGSGPAGFSAAVRGVDFGMKVCLIEGGHLGGAGIMNGALTSKTMYELSLDYSVAARVDRGYRASGLTVDYKQVRNTVIQAAKEKQYQMRSQIETFARNKQMQGSITLIHGMASFIDQHTLSVKTESGEENIKGENILIATGSQPRKYPDLEVDGERIINSEGILSLKHFPERILIIGSGIIGCEFATIFSNFKQTEVHLVDRANRVLPYEDDDVSDYVAENLTGNGVTIHHTAQLRTIVKHPGHLEVILDYDNGHSKVLEVDVALISIGRVSNLKYLKPENAGLTPTDKGILEINDNCQVIINGQPSNIYAAGDVTGHSQLYSVAELQGRKAVEKMAGKVGYPLDYSHMSTLMFFKPEVAAVGANEKMLQKAGIAYKAAYYSNKLINRAIAMRSTTGFIKILVSDDHEQRILGMRASGPQASSYIVSVAHLINQGDSLGEVLKIFYPHPSVAEGIQECLRTIGKRSIYKPMAFPDEIYIREWKPSDQMDQS